MNLAMAYQHEQLHRALNPSWGRKHGEGRVTELFSDADGSFRRRIIHPWGSTNGSHR